MYNVILVIHVILAFALVGIILIQRPDDSSMAGLAGGDNMGFLSGKSTGNLITKTTSILAVLFIVTSLSLAVIAKEDARKLAIIKEDPIVKKEEKPAKKDKKKEEKQEAQIDIKEGEKAEETPAPPVAKE